MLGIVILNYKTWESTLECVNSVKESDDVEKRIYIVDNNSPNNSYEMLSKYYKFDSQVEVILSNENGGYAKGNNIGIDACIKDKIKFALITNNDVLFAKNSIKKMYEFIKKRNNTAIVGPKIFNVDKKVMSLPFLSKQSLYQYMGIKSNKNLILSENNANETRQVYMVPGSCFTINVDLFKNMGAFDEGTFLYNEEGIISAQASKKGYEIMFLPDAEVIHDHGTSTGKSNLFIEGELLISGLYYWKNYENLSKTKLIILFLFMFIRTVAKILTNRVSAKNFYSYCSCVFKAITLNVIK